MKNLILTILICAVFATMTFGQMSIQTEIPETYKRHFIGSSLWSVYDKFAPDPSGFYQLSYGYHYTPKDVFMIEAITWGYSEPLGTYENSKEEYPGKVRAYGIGVGYQRFLWKNLYSSIMATSFLQQFYDENDKKIQKGYQLYLQLFVGYRFEFFDKRFFVEPAAALKYWPVNTNVPDSFADINIGTNNYIVEPSLNFGIRF